MDSKPLRETILEIIKENPESINKLFVENEHIITSFMHKTASSGDLESLKLLISNGGNIENGEVVGWTPIMEAVNVNEIQCVEYLLSRGANISLKTPLKTTPLHLACFWGYTDVVKMLLENGANPNIKNINYGETPLHISSSEGHWECIKLLMEHGASNNIKDGEGNTPSDCANSREWRKYIKNFQYLP